MMKPNSRSHGSSKQRTVQAGKKCRPTWKMNIFIKRKPGGATTMQLLTVPYMRSIPNRMVSKTVHIPLAIVYRMNINIYWFGHWHSKHVDKITLHFRCRKTIQDITRQHRKHAPSTDPMENRNNISNETISSSSPKLHSPLSSQLEHPPGHRTHV